MPTPNETALTAPERLDGERVRLRRSVAQDAAALYAAAHDPRVMRFVDWPLQLAPGEAWAFLDAAALRWRQGSEFHWMIEPADGAGAPYGCIACRPRGHAVDFGFLLRADAWHQGYATEAARLLVGWLKGRPGVHRIWALVDAENRRAAAVLQRAGLKYEGLLRRATLRPNLARDPRDSEIWALARDDF